MTFSELGFKEREHLQEWLANEPMNDLRVTDGKIEDILNTEKSVELWKRLCIISA